MGNRGKIRNSGKPMTRVKLFMIGGDSIFLFLFLFISFFSLYPFSSVTFVTCSNFYSRKNRYQRHVEILKSLDDSLPLVIIEDYVMKYDLEIDYRDEFRHVIKVLRLKEISPLIFYSDNFIVDLAEYIISLPFSIEFDTEFHENLTRLIFKWKLLKEAEHSMDAGKFQEIHIETQFLARVLRERVKKTNGIMHVQFGKFDFSNKNLFRHFVFMEFVKQWDSLIISLKLIYKDCYLNGLCRNEIILKYFQGNLSNDPILRNFLEMQNRIELREFMNTNLDCKLMKSFSKDQVDRIILENSLMVANFSRLFTLNELRLLLNGKHKLFIPIDRIPDAIRKFYEIGLWTREKAEKMLLEYKKIQKSLKNQDDHKLFYQEFQKLSIS